MIVLNRVLEWHSGYISLEADPRHVELILQEMNMEGCKGSKCIAMEHNAGEPQDEELLGRDEQRAYRSLAARLNFLAADRMDIQFACKEICRRMSGPTRTDWSLVKKVCRYLRESPRMVMKFEEQEAPRQVEVVVDTDYAGCRRTRRSTNGGFVQHGRHLLKSWSTTQSVVALSSGEAEFYGVVKGACEGLGVSGLLEDLGRSGMSIVLATDSSAAKGIASRRGVGKVRHLETRTLWIQDHVTSGRIRMKKILGTENPADIMTKYLSAPKLSSLLARIPLQRCGGRSALAPKLQGTS